MRVDDYCVVVEPRRAQCRCGLLAAIAVAASVWLFASAAFAQDAAADFRANCAGCHSIGGGRLVGPDLKDVTQRRDRAWLAHFISDPKAALDSGDAYAL